MTAHEELVREYVMRLVAEAPPLTDRQIEGAARILATVEPNPELAELPRPDSAVLGDRRRSGEGPG